MTETELGKHPTKRLIGLKNPKPFKPSLNIFKHSEWDRLGRPKFFEVKAVAPSRLHFAVLDPLSLDMGKPRGGGIGCSSLAATSSVTLNVCDETDWTPPRSAVVEHCIAVYCELVNFSRMRILAPSVRSIGWSHSGLGSNVSLGMATFFAMNELFGRPFLWHEVIDIASHNYVEDCGSGQLVWGFNTGVGEYCVSLGGIVGVSTNGTLLGHAAAENFHSLVLVPNSAVRHESEMRGAEIDALLQIRKYAPDIARRRLIPLLQKQDVSSALVVLERWTRGFYRRHDDGSTAVQKMQEIKRLLAGKWTGFAGISSEGPSIFLISDRSSKSAEILRYLEGACDLSGYTKLEGPLGGGISVQLM